MGKSTASKVKCEKAGMANLRNANLKKLKHSFTEFYIRLYMVDFHFLFCQKDSEMHPKFMRKCLQLIQTLVTSGHSKLHGENAGLRGVGQE